MFFCKVPIFSRSFPRWKNANVHNLNQSKKSKISLFLNSFCELFEQFRETTTTEPNRYPKDVFEKTPAVLLEKCLK